MQEKVQELLEFDQVSKPRATFLSDISHKVESMLVTLTFNNWFQDSESDSDSENNLQQPKLIKRASNVLTRGKYKDNVPLKKRLHVLVKCVMEYVVSCSHLWRDFISQL